MRIYLTGKRHHNFKHGRYCYITDKYGAKRKVNSFGYILVYYPWHPHADNSGFIFEHIFVFEKKLKRYLKPSEIVSHINGDRKDNRIENLRLFENRDDFNRANLERRFPGCCMKHDAGAVYRMVKEIFGVDRFISQPYEKSE